MKTDLPPIPKFIDRVLLSIVAAIIFWLIFSYFPERHRRKRLRPKLELGIYQVYRNLFWMFKLIMQSNTPSGSGFQAAINGGRLSPQDIELGLQNKCLNKTFLYDANVSQSLMVIGRELFERATEIDEDIERVFNFSNYLTPNEILLLERIRGKLHMYDLKGFDKPATHVIGGTQYAPINPSLSYMRENFSQLFELFGQLQNVVFRNKYEDRDVLLDKIQSYHEKRKYRKCKRAIQIAQAEYPHDKTLWELYLFLCEHGDGNNTTACRKLDRILKDKPHLVSERGFLADLRADSGIWQIVEKHYTEAEIMEFDSVVREETKARTDFILQANRLKKYYQDKANSQLNRRDR